MVMTQEDRRASSIEVEELRMRNISYLYWLWFHSKLELLIRPLFCTITCSQDIFLTFSHIRTHSPHMIRT